ncbi:30S ribosomal protein S20 [Candidatus Gracilibacteria bacterium]|nr:30S ribosomal protein S20 [Candidatus Gracilibacteria bacterium]
MPIIKSAIKRVRQTHTRTRRNTIVKKSYKLLVKDFLLLIDQKKVEEAAKLYPQIQKAIDLAGKQNILHPNAAARKKSRLAKLIAQSGVSGVKAAGEKKASLKKEITPKVTTPKKETSVKKPAAKKKTAKK